MTDEDLLQWELYKGDTKKEFMVLVESLFDNPKNDRIYTKLVNLVNTFPITTNHQIKLGSGSI